MEATIQEAGALSSISQQSVPVWRRVCVAALVLATTVGTRADGERQPAPPAIAPDAAQPGRLAGLSDVVWVSEGGDVAEGTLYVFLSTNVLVISSAGSTPTLGTWAADADGLVVREHGIAYEVDVVELSADRLRVRIHNPGTPTDVTFSRADRRQERPDRRPSGRTRGPAPSFYRCAGATYQVAFEGGAAHVTTPEGTSLVLAEMKVAEAPASRRTFSNGALTFVQDTSESYTRVLFARGRALPRPCSLVE